MNDSVKVTNAEMVQYVTNAIDTWAETLGEILTMLDEVVDSTNGEFVANNLVEKINYIEETKELIRQAINDAGSALGEEVPFRKYPEYIRGIPMIQFTPAVTHYKKAIVKINIGLDIERIFEVPTRRVEVRKARRYFHSINHNNEQYYNTKNVNIRKETE